MKGRIVWSVRQGLGEEKRKLTERYKYARKAPELALDLFVRAITVESERSGWSLEVIPVPRVAQDYCTAGRGQ
jgi:hypothetical protein